jgi:hypothetical protein
LINNVSFVNVGETGLSPYPTKSPSVAVLTFLASARYAWPARYFTTCVSAFFIYFRGKTAFQQLIDFHEAWYEYQVTGYCNIGSL